MNRNTSMQYEFDKEIFHDKDDIVLIGIFLPNIIYFIAMLFGCIMPIGATIGLAAGISVWITILNLSRCVFIKQSSGWKSVAALLKFYPTERSAIRISIYFIILRSMLLELIITAIPMIMCFYFFNIFKFMAALITIVVTMIVINIILIEISINR